MNQHKSADRSAANASGETELAHLLDEYLSALERGERPCVQDLIEQHAGIAGQFQECLQSLRSIEAVAATLQPASDESHAETQPLGDFQLERVIGRGGMGIVYSARQLSLDRRVAVKILPLAATYDDRQLQRFRNESHAAATLDHPHIVRVFAVGCERSVHYYAMQYVDGQTLAEQIENISSIRSLTRGDDLSADMRSGSLSSSQPGSRAYNRAAAGIGRQIGEALQHAHSRGVIHRDIKPSNVLVDRQGHVYVADFGLAHLPVDSGLTGTGDVVGTLRHMSPEQALGRNDQVDQRTDVYALGLVLYELLTLRRAFDGDDRAQLLQRIIDEAPVPPRQIDRSIPMDLETIVLKAISKQRDERYGSAQELADDLQRFLDGQPIRAQRPGPVDRLVAWTRRRQKALLAVTGLLLLMVIGLSIGTFLIAERERELRLALWRSHVDRAARSSRDRRPNGRFDALEQLRHALQLAPTLEIGDGDWLEMRSIAVTALTSADIRPADTWMLPTDGVPLLDRQLRYCCFLNRAQELVTLQIPEREELDRIPFPDSVLRVLAVSPERGSAVLEIETDSPDGRLDVELWDLATRQPVCTLPVPQDREVEPGEQWCDFSPDGQWLALGHVSSISVFECRSGARVHHQQFSTGDIPEAEHVIVRFNRDGSQLGVLDPMTQKVRVLDSMTWRVAREMNPRWDLASSESVSWHPSLPMLACAAYSRVNVLESDRLRWRAGIYQTDRNLLHVEFSSSGNLLTTVEQSETCRLWNPWAHRELVLVPGPVRSPVCFQSDDEALGHADVGRVEFLELAEPLGFRSWAFDREGALDSGLAHRLAIDSEAGLLACSLAGNVVLCSLHSAQEVAFLPGSAGLAVQADPTGGFFVAMASGVLRWPISERSSPSGQDWQIGPPVGLTLANRDWVVPTEFVGYSVHLNADGSRLCRLDDDHVHVYDLPETRLLRKWGPLAGTTSVELSPDGRWFADCYPTRDVRPLIRPVDPESAAEVATGEVSRTSAWFSPDSRHVLYDADEHYVLSGITMGGTLLTIPHRLGVAPGVAAFCSDGRMLAVLVSPDQLRLMDLHTGQSMLDLTINHPAAILEVCMDHNRQWVVALQDPDRILVWNLMELRRGLAAIELDWVMPDSTVTETPILTPTQLYVDHGLLTSSRGLSAEALYSLSVADGGGERFLAEVAQHQFLTYIPESDRGRLTVSINFDAAALYAIHVTFEHGPDCGDIRLLIDGQPQGEIWPGYGSEPALSGVVRFGAVELSAGTHEFEFEVVGKDDRSSGYRIGIASIACSPERDRNSAD